MTPKENGSMADLVASVIHRLPPVRRWSLRCRAGSVAAIGAALGLPLPEAMCRANGQDGRAALHLGPDEWLLRAPDDDAAWVASIAAAVQGKPFSLVGIGDRQLGLMITGPSAEAILSAGCPLDLGEKAFPIGMCTRTIFAKAEVLLWRRDEGFIVEYWRSFADYIEGLLDQAENDLAW
jgi:sarcosine oxidase, subunit gamma